MRMRFLPKRAPKRAGNLVKRHRIIDIMKYLNISCIDSLPPPCPVSVNYRHWHVGILVFHFRITVGIFLLYDLVGTPFEDFAGTLFLKIWQEFLSSLKRSVKCTKGGRSPPPFGKRGLPPIIKY